MKGKKIKRKGTVLLSFCSLGRGEKKKPTTSTTRRCVKAAPPTRVVKTFYEQTMSVYWNHMITEMGSFIVFRPIPSVPHLPPTPLPTRGRSLPVSLRPGAEPKPRF